MTSIQRQVKTLQRRIAARIKKLSETRDKLRADLADFAAIAEDADSAIEQFESGLDTLSQLI